MIVFDLVCATGHRFEGWFRSSDDFAAQRDGGDLACPVCNTQAVVKAPMAPAIPAKSNGEAHRSRNERNARPRTDEPPPAKVAKAMKALAAMQAAALKDSTYVGDNFPEVSRAMHYGEKEAAIIHGKASLDDAKGLADEGINVTPLPFPVSKPDELN